LRKDKSKKVNPRRKIMKKLTKFIVVGLVLVGSNQWSRAGVNIVDDFIILNALGTGATFSGQKYYDVKRDTTLLNPTFNGANLGTFNILSTDVTIGGNTYSAGGLLQLKGAELKTDVTGGGDYQNGSNFGRLFYAVTAAGVNPSSFTTLDMSLISASWPNYTWANTATSVNLLQGLAEGSYKLTAYFETNGSYFTSSQQFYSINPDNNSGANYVATFNVVPEPSTGVLMGLGFAGLVTIRLFRKKS
jgi:PEP-CTERM motif